ncbi:MAG: hypothetical protein ACI9GZ_003782, partial [Bacteroidia bacterium]
ALKSKSNIENQHSPLLVRQTNPNGSADFQ